MDVLDAVGSMMAPLAMMVIGLQLTSSKPRAVMTNHKLIIMCAIRLLVIPGLLFFMLLPFYHYRLITGIEIGIVTLSAMLPCATVSAVLAEEYGRNARLAAEGIFLSTLFSMLTIPVGGIFLSML
jgi:predicted permease